MKTSIVILIVIFVGCLSAAPADDNKLSEGDESEVPKENKLQAVAVKFEQYGRDRSKTSPDVTYDELDAAYEDYCDQKRHLGGDEFFEAARKKSTVFCLIDDFVLTPMKYFRLSANEDEPTKAAYMKRTQKFFRLFWPAYVEGRLIGKKYLYKAKRFLRFLSAFEGSSEEQPTRMMWKLAHGEYNALEQKAKEVVTSEDIFLMAQDYGLMLNLFNDARVTVLRERFFDRLDRCKTDKQLLELQAEYKQLNFD